MIQGPRNGITLACCVRLMNHAYLSLGSNLGDRLQLLRSAVDGLRRHARIQIPATGIASLYETKPHGVSECQPLYLNTTVQVATSLNPHELLAVMLETERKMGRHRQRPNEPRLIDLDMLLYGDLVLDEPGLVLPHPRMHERLFVLEPLSEVAPDVVHPRLERSIRSLRDSLASQSSGVVTTIAGPDWTDSGVVPRL